MESNNINTTEEKLDILESIVVEGTDNWSAIKKAEDTKERKLMRDNFAFFALGSLIYAVLSTFCIYDNLYGITTSLFVIFTLVYAYLGLKKVGVDLKKKHMVYAAAITLIGINLFITADMIILFVDYVAIIMLFASGLLSVIYDDSKWSFGEALYSVMDQVFGALGEVFSFEFSKDWSIYSKEKSAKAAIIKYVIIGIVCAVPLLLVVILLLSSADAVFNSVTEKMFSDVNFGTIIGITIMFVCMLLGSYAWFTKLLNKTLNLRITDKKVLEPIILIIINVCLGVVYVFFCGIQIIYLFAGAGDLPKGYTYAMYAREGFFQLLFVCFINLMLILIGVKRFKTSKVLNVAMTVITVCTYIMIASSVFRMYLYISEYQLTLLRVWVLFALVLITAILTGAMISIYKDSFPLFKYCVMATTILYILFAFAKPSAMVAQYNLSGAFAKEDIDFLYIENDLFPDAVPAMQKYEKEHSFTFEYDNLITGEEKDIRGFNISSYRLEKELCR